MFPKVAIAIVNWNNYADTRECLQSLQSITYPNYEIIVVDNGSTDGSGCRLKAEFPQREFITLGENLGFAAGNNVGIRYALDRGTDYVLLLNNDTKVSEDFLERMVTTALKHPRIGLVGCKIYYGHDPERVQFRGGWGNHWLDRFDQLAVDHGEAEVNFVSGCAMLVKGEVFEDIGYFEEKYFMYVEDVNFCYKAERAGWKMFVNLDAEIWHKASASTGGEAGPHACYYVARNGLYYITEEFSGIQRLSSLFFFLLRRLIEIAKWTILGKRALARARLIGMADFLKKRTGRVNTPL